MTYNIPFYRILILLSLFVFASCFPVQRAALEFAEHKNNLVVLIIPPPNLFLSYFPYNPDENEDDDRIYNIEDSEFLKQIEDSLFFDLFLQGLRESIKKYNIDVFKSDSIDVFFRQEREAYIFSVAQMELIEYKDTFVQQAVYENALYVQEFERNNILNNTWFEFTELNNTERPKQVLYSMQYTGDYFDGNFRMNWFSGEVIYQFTPYKIEIDDIYQLAYFSGIQNGEYIVNYLFNLYLEDRIGKDRLRHYYRYDRYRNAAQKSTNDRFIIISQ